MTYAEAKRIREFLRLKESDGNDNSELMIEELYQKVISEIEGEKKNNQRRKNSCLREQITYWLEYFKDNKMEHENLELQDRLKNFITSMLGM